MFKNFQEHFESAKESQHATEFRFLNPRHDRLKLIISAILIPISCSFFYFLLSGHKYAELESAIGDIESVKSAELISDSTTQSTTEPVVNTAVINTAMESNPQPITNRQSTDQSTQIIQSTQATGNASLAAVDRSAQSESQILADGSVYSDVDSASSSTTQTLPVDSQVNPAFESTKITTNETDIASKTPESVKSTVSIEEIPEEEISPGRNLTELTELVIADDIFETNSDSAYQNAIPGRGQTEVAMLVSDGNENSTQNTTEQNITKSKAINVDTSVVSAANVANKPNLEIKPTVINTQVNEQEYLAQQTQVESPQAESKEESKDESKSVALSQPLLTASALHDQESQIESGTTPIITNDDARTDSKAIELKQQQLQESKIILVDKIVGLLKSEVINPNATADAGKRKQSNRHSHTDKKSLDIDKLESILEDI